MSSGSACDVIQRSADAAAMTSLSMASLLKPVIMVTTCLLFGLRHHDVTEAISLAPVSWNRSNPM